MRRQQNKYRNRLGPTATGYMVLVGVIITVIGSAYVYVKNQHLAREDIKRTIQEDILRFNAESDQLQSRIDARLSRSQIYETLNLRKSPLERIPAGAITTIAPADVPRVETGEEPVTPR